MLFQWHLKTKFLIGIPVTQFFQTTLSFVIREIVLALPVCGEFISTKVIDTQLLYSLLFHLVRRHHLMKISP